MTKHYKYIVDLNERGNYYAHVEDVKTEKTVFSLTNENEEIDEEGNTYTEYGALWIVEFGYMKHVEDMDGLQDYLEEMKIIPHDSVIHYVG